MKYMNQFALVLSLLLASNASAKIFQNQYVEFELPAGWDCKIEKSEWVCQSNNPDIKKEAIVICAAKQRGPDDDLAKYAEHLNQPRPKTDLSGNPYSSQVVFAKQTVIKGHPWVDGMHFGSEIPGFYTRYLSTVAGRVAMLLTWSVSKASYQKMKGDMDTFVASLKAIDNPGAAVASGAGADLNHPLGSEPAIPESASKPASEAGASKKMDPATLGGGALLLAALAFLVMRMKKKNS